MIGFLTLTTLDLRDDKRTELSISRITKGQFEQLLAEHGLKRATVECLPSEDVQDIPVFHWTAQTESAQSAEYIHWLSKTIPLPDNLEYYCTSRETDFLTTTCASVRYTLKGTLDAAVVSRAYVRSYNAAAGIRVGIELKKKVAQKDSMQAIAELLSASALSNYRVAVLLTDLNDFWQFFWLAKGKIVDCSLGRPQAAILLQTLASETGSTVSTSENEATPNAPWRERCTLEELYGRKASGDEVDGLESLLKRPKFDIMEMLPREDVGDMGDVFDVMSPEEIGEWKRKKALEFLIRTPAMQSTVTTREGWQAMYA
jgi:hypothetical protein